MTEESQASRSRRPGGGQIPAHDGVDLTIGGGRSVAVVGRSRGGSSAFRSVVTDRKKERKSESRSERFSG